jgi:ATP adenylyltransferase
MQYVTTSGGSEGGGTGCVFCDHLAQGDDEAAHILYRGGATFVILNAFPYNTGHLLVAPNRHVADLGDLGSDVRTELMEITFQSTAILKETMGAPGFNVGINLGAEAGAGIPGHLHVHVVPRWSGDTNFMPVIGGTKVLPEMLAQTDAKLRPAFAAL